MKSILFLSTCLFGWILAGDGTTTRPTLTSLSPKTVEAVETVKAIKRDPIVTKTREKSDATKETKSKDTLGDQVDKEERDRKEAREKEKGAPEDEKDKEVDDGGQIADGSTDANEHEHEEQSIEAEVPDHGGDTKIVQNNYNIPNAGWHRFASSEAFTFVSGVLLIIILLLGITVLAIVLVKLVHNGDHPSKPMLVPPPMGVHWRNDLDYSLGGQFGGPPPPPEHAFSDQPLHHPAKKML